MLAKKVQGTQLPTYKIKMATRSLAFVLSLSSSMRTAITTAHKLQLWRRTYVGLAYNKPVAPAAFGNAIQGIQTVDRSHDGGDEKVKSRRVSTGISDVREGTWS